MVGWRINTVTEKRQNYSKQYIFPRVRYERKSVMWLNVEARYEMETQIDTHTAYNTNTNTSFDFFLHIFHIFSVAFSDHTRWGPYDNRNMLTQSFMV